MPLDLSAFLKGSDSPRKVLAGQPIFAIDEPGRSMFVVRRLRATTFLTHHDAVTHLPNRHRFLELCRAALSSAEQQGTPVGMLLVGIDHFARLNESFGNAIGDEVLRAVGARLGDGGDS